MSYKQRRVLNGLLVGLAGGLAATYVMTQFQTGSTKVAEAIKKDQRQNEEGQKQEAEPATVKVATKISRSMFHRELKEENKEKYGNIVHYAFGGLMGGLYGAAAELRPEVTRGLGTLFGAALFLAADEIAVPALGLGKGPTETPIGVHAQALASHLVYAAALDGVRRAASNMI